MKAICVLTNVSNKKISGYIEFEQIKQINNKIWLLITINPHLFWGTVSEGILEQIVSSAGFLETFSFRLFRISHPDF